MLKHIGPIWKCSIVFALLFITPLVYGQTVEICNDGIDNDGNGLVDCDDPFCQFAANVEKGCHCFDNIDNDGDGVIDKADPNCASYYGLTFVGQGSDCSITPPAGSDPFAGIGAPAVSGQNTSDTQSKVSVGDVDGDGIPDAVITSKWNSTIRVVATSNGQADGSNAGDIKADFKTTGQGAKIFSGSGACNPKNLLFEHENLIADIDGDGKAELFGIVSNRGGNPSTPPTCFFMVAFKYAPGSLVPLYNAVQIGTDRPGVFGVADMDGDGKAEIYMRDRIYAAETGVLLASGGGNWDLDITSGPVAVNISGDSKMELVCGTKIFSIPSLTNRTPASPAALTLSSDMNAISADKCFVKLANDPVEYGVDTHSMCSVADIDRDGNIDVIISGALNSASGSTAVFYWNVAKGTVNYYLPPDPVYASGWPWGTGRVNLGDANGDGKTDLTFMAGNQLFCMTTDATGAIVPLWASPRTVNDSRSGVLTVTIYDFDNDGNPELVYRDSQELVVVDGATGANKLWSATCQSHTYTEGPIIADVNGDGATDICVPCNRNNSFDINDPIQQQALGEVRLFFSNGNQWLPTRKVWNQPGYFVVNINDDLTLPFPQLDQNLVFSNAPCPNGTPGPQVPLNVFLNQIPFLSASGCPIFPAPDLTFFGDDPDNPGVDSDGNGVYTPAVVVTPPICGNLDISAYFNIVNNGDLPITDTVPVAFFNGDPTAGGTFLYKANLTINNLQVNQTLQTPAVTFNGPGTVFDLYIVLYSDGTLPLVINSTKECTIANNTYKVLVSPDPFTTTIEKISDNFKCANSAPDTGELRAHIFKGGVETNDYSPFSFQWYTGTDTSTPIPAPGGTAYNLVGVAEGTYTLVITNTQKGCQSDPISETIVRLGNDPDVSITVVSDQTQCSPANGQLKADIVGGNTGYNFEWFDISLNPLGITGPTANNLSAGNYVVRVSKDGCTKTSAPVTVNGPQIPDAQAQVLQNVVDCSNPNSGSIQADAYINSVLQDPAGYTFDWYFYDNATSTRGSILPAANGTGQTRTGLAVGYYQAVIKQIATQCVSGQSPIVQVLNSTVVPTATITQVAPQTSCDPANPNGILTADALVGGVVQNPADFTFEWFKGDNTLPANLHTTVSGTNGQTAEKVSGGGVFYTVKVTTAFNCFATNKFIIAENINVPVVTVTPTNNSICDPVFAGTTFNGALSASVTFGGNPVSDFSNYKFTWHQGSLTSDPVIAVADDKLPSLSQLDGGYYTVVAERSDLSCASIPVTEEVVNAPVLPAIVTNNVGSTNCPGGAANGVLDAAVDLGGSTTISGYTFNWYQGDDTSGTLAGSTAVVNGQQGGQDFTIEVKNNSTGCSNTLTNLLQDNSGPPVLSLTPSDNTICDPLLGYNGSIASSFVDANGLGSHTYSYVWSTGMDMTNPIGGQTSATLPGQNGGFYTATIKNNTLNCTSDPVIAEIKNNLVIPVIQKTLTPSTNCPGGAPNGVLDAVVDLGGGSFTTAGYDFEWFQGNSTSDPSVGTAATINGQQGGQNFTVEVTNTTSGCSDVSSGTLVDNSKLPLLSLNPSPNSICDPLIGFDGSIASSLVDANGLPAHTYTYTWSTGMDMTSPIAGQTASSLPGRDGGFYTATVKNNTLNCTSDPVIAEIKNVQVFPAIVTTLTPSTNCAGGAANGGLDAAVDLGGGASTTVGYSFEWFKGNTTSDPSVASVPTVNGQQGGQNYTVEVRNSTTGCTNTSTQILADNKVLPVLSLTPTDNTICIPNPNYDGQVASSFVDVNGQVGHTYKYTWSTGMDMLSPIGGQTNPTLPNRQAGYFTATITNNALNCTSAPVTAQVKDNLFIPLINIASTNQTSCDVANPNGALAATIDEMSIGGGPGTTAGYNFTWTDDATSTTVPNVSGAINQLKGNRFFTVDVTRPATGCANAKTIFLDEAIIIPPVAVVVGSDVTRCDTPNGNLTASVGGVQAGYTFYWYNNNDAPDETFVIANNDYNAANDGTYINLIPGDYTVVAVDNTTTCASVPVIQPVALNVSPINININILTVPTVCGDANGSFDATANGVTAGYDFDWYDGAPTNTGVIDYFTNPPAFNPALAFVSIPTPVGLIEGVYTLEVTDQSNGCKNFETISMPFASAPVIVPRSVNSTLCPYTTGNGEIHLEIFPPPPPDAPVGTNETDYIVRLFQDGVQIGADLVPGVAAGEFAVNTALAPGSYTISVQETYTGSNCIVTAGFVIGADALPPVVSLVGSVISNTACSVAAVDGQIEINVDKDPDDLTAPTFDIDMNPDPNGLFPQLAQPSGNYIASNLSPATYTFVVTASTGCSATKSFTVLDNPVVSQLSDADMIIRDAEFCLAPLETSASVEITDVQLTSGGAELIDDYQFDWFTDASLNAGFRILQAGGDGSAAKGGEILSNVGAPLPTAPVTFGSYWVKVTKVADGSGTGGIGCFSAPLRADILDHTVNPVATLTPFSNTACDGNFEGQIQIDATTPVVFGAPDVSPGNGGTYSYAWTSSVAPPPNSAGQSGIANLTAKTLQDGTYTATITNEVTGCAVIANTTILKISPPVFTLTASSTPQQLCNPDGTITVNDTFLNGLSDGGTGNFDFTWFKDSPGNPPLEDGTNTVIVANQIDNSNYLTIGQGTYYVVATRKANTDPGSGCSSAPFKIDIDDTSVDPVAQLSPFSNTSCDANFEGSLQLSVSTQAGTPGELSDYTYAWVVTSTTTPPAPANGAGNELYTLLEDGVYTLTATNNITGCFAQATASILESQTPVVIVSATPTPQALCTPDGAVQIDDVTVNNISDLANLTTNFTYTWFAGSLTNPIPGVTTPNLNIGNFPTIAAGDYLVKAKRNPNTSPGSGCESAPLKVTIDDVSVDPTISFSQLANTACDNNFDGQITVTGNTASGPGVGSNYDFEWTSVPVLSSVADELNAPGPHVTAAPDVVGPGTYTIRVRNVNTQCFSNGFVTLQTNPQPLDILTVNKTNQLICLPDGSITVSSLSSGVVGDYTFEWHQGTATSPPLVDGGSVTITSPTLTTANYPTLASGTYFVKGTKNPGLTPGSGCPTPPFRVDLLDQHKDPRTQFSFQPNSSCDVTNPNGAILANAAEQNGTNTDLYNFAWTYNNGALPGVTSIASTNNSNQLDNAFEGTYGLTILNTTTGCQFVSGLDVNLDLNISLPNIIDVFTVDPLDCLGSGSGEVTSISIGGGPAVTGAALGTDFSYEWYADDVVAGNLVRDNLNNPVTTPLIGSLAPRNYYVLVTDLSTLCKSGPKEMVINDDKIVYPDVRIAQTAKQISCLTTSGVAALASTADGQDDTDPNYQFSWFSTLDATGPLFASTSAITDLNAGDYSVSVLNTATGCASQALYIIPDEAPAYTPVISLGGQPRTLCVGQDGSVLARVIDIKPDYPFPLDFTADLYFGSTPNLAATPDVPNMGLVPGFTVNFVESNLAEGFYTVRITDNNTGCSAVLTGEVADERTPPVVTVMEDNPLTNCDPQRANGQLAATADDGKVGGYTFEWYQGTTISTPPPTLLASGNLLIAQAAGDYVVRVINNISGCFSDLMGAITDATVTPPIPTGIVVADRTNCLVPNGWVTANVGGETLNYSFSWYDGNTASGSPDFNGIDYQDRDVGNYAVTATDDITGCVSPPAVVAVKDARVIPEFKFETTASYCSDVGKPKGIGSVVLYPTNEVAISQVTWFDVNTSGIVGTGDAVYDLFPGVYRAEVVTTEGCTNEGLAEVETEINPYNGVSVNGDGQNDFFIIDCISNFPNNNVKIFNRSGVKVYEVDGYDNMIRTFRGVGENGIYLQGVDLPVGTYFYIIDKRNGSKPVAGYLELNR